MSINSIIDSHVHFWDPQHLRYPWLDKVERLNRRFDPSDYQSATADIPIEKIVFAECDIQPQLNIAEVEWIEKLAEKDRRIVGIVAHANMLDEKELNADLEKLSAHSMVKGIRHLIQDHGLGFCTQKAFVDGVRTVGKYGFHFEICIYHPQMKDVLELVSQCPDMRFVLNHCGKPGIKDRLWEPWNAQIKQLSEHENVVCKISALLTEADWENWTNEDIKPYCEHVVNCFGTKRIIYGGDWPVVTLAGGYRAWYSFTEFLTADWSDEEKRHYYYENALRYYGL